MVDEKGTVATTAISTAIVVVSASYDVVFDANHPFIFIIWEKYVAGIVTIGLEISD